MQKMFLKASKTKVVSIKDFYEETGCLKGYKHSEWKKEKEPDFWTIYYKFTSNLLLWIDFGCLMKKYGTKPTPKLEEIMVAFRDGETEYQLISEKLNELKSQKPKSKRSKALTEEIEWLEYLDKNIREILPPFTKPFKFNTGEKTCAESITIDETKISKSELASQYVVLDIETNGLRTANDDLLSISIFDPSNGKIYNRLLPLELQPTVLTTYINGIDDSDIEKEVPISQKEFNDLISEFNLENRTILFYAGGNFDFDFLDKYCKRHKIEGMERLTFKNIKSNIAAERFMEGKITKDNLCVALGIEGVSEKHSSINDCFLEWQLFEQALHKNIFVKEKGVYIFSDEYVIPSSYLAECPKLAQFSGIEIPKLKYRKRLLYEYYLPADLIKKVKKFPNNISGISVERLINYMIGAKECDNTEFLCENSKKLQKIGQLVTNRIAIPVKDAKDGSFISFFSEYEEHVKRVNEVNKIIKSGIEEVIDFIKKELFKNKEIRTQEITFSENNKILALCDLSTDDAVLEIKTFDIFNSYKTESVIRQMYYQKGKKKLYAMSIIFEMKRTSRGDFRLNNLIFRIHKVMISKEKE